MLCFSWSISISTCNPFSHSCPLFYVHTHAHTGYLLGTHTHTSSWTAPSRGMMVGWDGDSLFFFFWKTKAPNCSDMAPLDLRHYWGQSWEEPCNLQDLLVHRFFPYLLHWKYAATQSLTGVTVAFSGELNRAEAVPCAISTDAFL